MEEDLKKEMNRLLTEIKSFKDYTNRFDSFNIRKVDSVKNLDGKPGDIVMIKGAKKGLGMAYRTDKDEWKSF